MEVRKFAEWKRSIGLEVIEQNIWKRRSDLRGNHLRYIVEKIKIRFALLILLSIVIDHQLNHISLALLPLSAHLSQHIWNMVVVHQNVSKGYMQIPL